MYELGIIIPVFKSTKSVKTIITTIEQYFSLRCSYHIYLIDDGNEISVKNYLNHHCKSPDVSIISLPFNQGQQAAILCGLSYATECNYIATMDDDLQHPVYVLSELYSKIKDGYDLVYAIPEKSPREQLSIRSMGSFLRDCFFYIIIRSKVKVSSFRIMTKQVALDCLAQENDFFYFSAAAFQKPRDVANIFYKSSQRTYGKSGYGFFKLITLYYQLLIHYSPFVQWLTQKKKKGGKLKCQQR